MHRLNGSIIQPHRSESGSGIIEIMNSHFRSRNSNEMSRNLYRPVDVRIVIDHTETTDATGNIKGEDLKVLRWWFPNWQPGWPSRERSCFRLFRQWERGRKTNNWVIYDDWQLNRWLPVKPAICLHWNCDYSLVRKEPKR